MRTKLSLKFFMRKADDVAGRNDNILNIFDKSRWLYRVIANVCFCVLAFFAVENHHPPEAPPPPKPPPPPENPPKPPKPLLPP